MHNCGAAAAGNFSYEGVLLNLYMYPHNRDTMGKMSTAYCKSFIPLESNPEVFTKLVHLLGGSDDLFFQDVVSLDEDLLPSSAIAFVLIFPTTDRYERHIETEDSNLPPDGHPQDNDIIWFKQTINNACGLYSVLHALCNGYARTMHSMYAL